MAYTCILVVTTECNTHHFRCKWSKADPVKGIDGQRHESLNVVLYPKKTLITQTEGTNGVASAVCYDDEQNVDKEFNTSWNLAPEITSFIIESINKCKGVDDKSPVIMKFILSREDGYLARSDFLQQRLDEVKHVSWVVGFLRPLQKVTTPRVQLDGTAHDLNMLLSISVGAILLDTGSGSDLHDTLHSVEEALCNRIAYPWVVPTPIVPKRLAWVEGRKDADASRRMYEAAAALGITLVIIDKPGHWLQNDHGPYAHLREGFIATNIDVDEGFVDRIVTAVRSYDKPIDGIMTVSDSRLIGVARACEILGYPTSPSSAYVLAGDKYQTRMMEPDAHGAAFRFFGTNELEKVLRSTVVTYPLIVKPCLGWGSQAVTKVSTEVELFKAVEKACECHALAPQQRSDAVIEPYIDGPEVDANFVLLNGEVIFCEISDDFPSPGDRDSQQSHNFVETMVHMPSALPPHELKAIWDTLHQSILRQGFLTGTFHCEARLQYSTLEFRQDDNGFEDLYPRRDATDDGKSVHVYLLEINARPAGYLETVGVNLVYGVDYFAQQMLFSVNDELRFKALCHPFSGGPHSNLSILVLQEDVAGIMKTEDATAELLRQYPELEPHVPLYATIKKKGDRLVGPKSSEVHFIAWMLVTAQKRRECLRLVQNIRSNFRYEVENETNCSNS